MVFKTGNMPAGVGVYGDVMRHVIGGRPEGWNYIAGQTQGWGGIDIGIFECLTRTGPLFMVEQEDLAPLPNLAKSWDWSEDGKELTIHLIEGAKWSDGDPFDAEDIMFYWDDHVMDPELTPLSGASPETFGVGTTLAKVDDFTVKFTFTQAFPESVLYALAYGTFCPQPSHVMKPLHPKYSDNTYEQYTNAFPPTYMNFPVMGAWVPVEYRPDDIVVLRRNPYYWKVDENGQQLPYLDELQYRLSTWADRDVQAVAGTGDFSNLEQPENFVESLRRGAEETAPARLEFGPRIIGYSLFPNFSGNGWGEPDARGQAIRELNRDQNFRMGLSHAIDRQRLGNSLVKGPFTAIYPGGMVSDSIYYDAASTVYYPYSVETAKALFEQAGLTDTDGNGFVNHPADVLGGADVQVVMLVNGDYQTDKTVAEAVIAMMAEAGIKVTLNTLSGNARDAEFESGRFDWAVRRNDPELITPGAEAVAARAGRAEDRAHARGERRGRARPPALRGAARRHGQRLHRQPRRRRAQGADGGVAEDLHRERLRDRTHPVPGRADHQQALLQHPAGRADLHVQLGRGQHHPRAGLGRRGPADRGRAAPEHSAGRTGRRRPDRVARPGCGGPRRRSPPPRSRAFAGAHPARFHR